jgi:hypothetical protein
MDVVLTADSNSKSTHEFNHGSSVDKIKAVLAVIKALHAAGESHPVGANIDVEPDTLEFPNPAGRSMPLIGYGKLSDDEKKAVWLNYTKLLEKLNAEVEAANNAWFAKVNGKDTKFKFLPPLTFTAAVPRWCPSKTNYNPNPGAKNLGDAILLSGADVAVMDYDANFGSAIGYAEDWVALATDRGRKAWILFEANGDASAPNYGASDKQLALNSDLQTLVAHPNIGGQPGFGGVAVDNAAWYGHFKLT